MKGILCPVMTHEGEQWEQIDFRGFGGLCLNMKCQPFGAPEEELSYRLLMRHPILYRPTGKGGVVYANVSTAEQIVKVFY